jgi:archaeosine-15-forming tRNA-guanine transglycosylase
MEAKPGDQIVVEAEKVGQAVRTGIVEEVLAKDPLRLRVRWEDGHTTVFAPTAGAARIESVKRRPATRQQ